MTEQKKIEVDAVTGTLNLVLAELQKAQIEITTTIQSQLAAIMRLQIELEAQGRLTLAAQFALNDLSATTDAMADTAEAWMPLTLMMCQLHTGPIAPAS